MEFVDIMLPTAPPKFKHECPACGRTATASKAYPTIAYEPAESQSPPST